MEKMINNRQCCENAIKLYMKIKFGICNITSDEISSLFDWILAH